MYEHTEAQGTGMPTRTAPIGSPTVRASLVRTGQNGVICLSGRTSSGKSTVAAALNRHGFEVRSTSVALSRLLDERGIRTTIDRRLLQRLGEEVHDTLGQEWLMRRVVSDLNADNRYVIDALRFREDRSFLVENFGSRVFQLHLDAPRQVRRSRFLKRGGTLLEFDNAETNITESEAEDLREEAEIVVDNPGSVAELELQVLILVQAWGERV